MKNLISVMSRTVSNSVGSHVVAVDAFLQAIERAGEKLSKEGTNHLVTVNR